MPKTETDVQGRNSKAERDLVEGGMEEVEELGTLEEQETGLSTRT